MKKVLFFSAILMVALGLGAAQAEQENKFALIAESQYFSVYADGPINAYSVISRLKFDYLKFGGKLGQGEEEDLGKILAKTLDGLFLEVSDVIDIHIYSFKGVIRVLPDKSSLAKLVKELYNYDFSERSLYFFEKNTIFISQQDLTLGMLGHEIAHAIISNFFVVPPPPKVQEILCGYVEYSLNKSHGS